MAEKLNKWIKSLVIWMGIWGIFNLFIAPLGGIILIFFAGLIYYTKSFKITYIFGIFWLIISIIQAFLSLYADIPFNLIFAVVNGAIALSILYMKYKVKIDENSNKVIS